MFKKGSKVRQVVPVIEGLIDQTRFNESAQSLEYHVTWGESARWFLEEDLELTKDQPEAPGEPAAPAA